MQEPQNPFFRPIPRDFLTEDELDQPIKVVKIKVYGSYSLRGEHRKEVVEKHYDAEIEVPENYNKGNVKLQINRHIKRELRGIRARTFHIDEEFEPVPLEHHRRVRDFISERGMRDNERAKRNYTRAVEKRKAEADAMAAGVAPAFTDNTSYGSDGLPPLSDKMYVSR